MSEKPRQKTSVVTFRVSDHLAEALNKLPDRSAFIREALERSFHETCPACNGEGRVDCDAAIWLRDVLDERGALNCECCGTAFPPADAGSTATNSSSKSNSKSNSKSKSKSKAKARTVCGHCGPDGHHH